MVKPAAEARSETAGRRLIELRERLTRLRAGEAPTREDVVRARAAALAQQDAARNAYQRLLQAHAAAVSQGLFMAALDAETAPPRQDHPGIPPDQNERLANAMAVMGRSAAQVRLWPHDRLHLVWHALVGECASAQWRGWAHALCVVATRLIPSVRGAALTLYDTDSVAYPFAASDGWARDVEQIHHIVGEGPALEVSHQRPATVVDDLRSASRRWPGFVDLAVAAGLRGVSAFFVDVGAPLTASLTLYHTTAATPRGPSTVDAAMLADIAASVLMVDVDALEAGGKGPDLDDLMAVNIATGILAVQLGITVAEAHLRLRAHAYASERTLTDAARSVIDRTSNLT